MEWRTITAREAPRLYHGTRFFDIKSILKNRTLPGKATDSGRNDILFSAALTASFKHKACAEGDLRDMWGYGNNGCDNDARERAGGWQVGRLLDPATCAAPQLRAHHVVACALGTRVAK